MKSYIVNVDIQWGTRWDEIGDDRLPTTLYDYEVEAEDENHLASELLYQLEREYDREIDGCAYDIMEVYELC